ncbi:MAG TPA: hypothetical protein VGF56_01300 [Rhizomicrobium sp.]|jgi:hypothetical protein
MKSALLAAAAFAAMSFAVQAAPAGGAAPTNPAVAQPGPAPTNPAIAQPGPAPINPKSATPGMTKPADSGPSCTQNIAPGQPPGCPPVNPNPSPEPPATPK